MVVRYICKGPQAYTIAGMPTITNGVASDFSNNDFCYIPAASFPSITSSFEHGIKFTTGTLSSSYMGLSGYSTSRAGFFISTTNTLGVHAINFFTGKRYQYGGTFTLEENTTYYAKYVNTSSETYVLYSLDGIYWEKEVITFGNINADALSDFKFGNTDTGTFNGSIDFNDTYIKIDGKMFFGEEIFVPKIQIDEAPSLLLTKDKKVLLRGEPAYELDTNSLKVGDGITAYSKLPYLVDNTGEWIKPKDWVDIRSGALDDSIYMLIAHSAPTENDGVYSIANYPKCSLRISLESGESSTADIFVDGVKIGTATHYTSFVIDWESLYNSGKVQTIHTTTHPSQLVYHVVRFAPTISTDKITAIRSTGVTDQIEQGIMWVHFQLSYPIGISSLLGAPTTIRNYLTEAVTAKNDKIIYRTTNTEASSGFYSAFAYCSSLVKIPILEADGTTNPSGTYVSFVSVPAKKIIIKNNSGLESIYCLSGSSIQEIDVENGLVLNNSSSSSINIQSKNLKKLPSVSKLIEGEYLVLSRFDSLEPTVLNDLSTLRKRIRFSGISSYRTDGLKELIVSSSAPFDGESPQININYTGLNRAALVNLFKSMPYNNTLNLAGNATITNGVLSGVWSTGSYAISNIQIPVNRNKLEIVLKMLCSGTVSSSNYIPIIGFANNNTSALPATKVTWSGGAGKGLHFDLNNDNTFLSSVYNSSFDFASYFTSNQYVFMKFIEEKVGDEWHYTVSGSADGTNWTDGNTYISQTALIGAKNIGFLRNGSGGGGDHGWAIDFNYSSILVDGVPWTNGIISAVTKTCSVVGCTGTADLTADDKAICTGKGWELTVE